MARLGLDFEWAPTTAAGDGIALARDAARRGFSPVVAVGGDGTLNEIVNGVTDDGGRALAGAAAILTGRGRDACRNFGLAADPLVAAARVAQGADVTFDLGMAEWSSGQRRYFAIAAGAGFDAAVARRAARSWGRGTVPYVLAILATLHAHRCVAVEIEVGATRLSGPIAAAVVANGAHYGGGMKIAPGADPTDGELDLVVLGGFSRLELLRWLPTVYGGTHVRSAKVTLARARRVRIVSASPLPTHLDGEPGADTPVTLTVCPRALRLRV